MSKKVEKSKKVIPKDESKQARFIRVVSPRVNKAVKAISVLGFCAGSTYEYTPDQATQIIETLLQAVTALDNKFMSKANKQDSFSFKE